MEDWPIRAPIRVKGSMMRRIGRLDSESSPIISVVNGRAATSPASILMVEPEFPASSGSGEERQHSNPRPSTVMVRSLSCLMSIPSRCRHDSVDWQSAPRE